MSKIFKAPVVLAPTTTLGHIATLPVLVAEGETIIMDQQVHSSVQYAAAHLQLKGVHVTIARHNNIEQLEEKVKALSAQHKRIWYACDGIYSMYGDCAPLKELLGLLDKYKYLYLYVDDAHGMSWTGDRGMGYALSQITLHPKMVLATSLNKAFAAGGSVFVFPNEEWANKVNCVGGPLIFAGQHQNAALGASIACATIHLSPEIYELQQDLAAKIAYCQQQLEKYELPIVSNPHAPIFFVGLGLTRMGYNLVNRMKEEGFYSNLAIFPAVPESCTGIRFTITRHHSFNDIEQFTAALAHHFTAALQEEGRSMDDIQRAFKKVAHFKDRATNMHLPNILSPEYNLQHETTIQNISPDMWNTYMGDKGMFDWNGMQFLESTFKDNSKPEHNWDFHYYIVRNKNGEILLVTFFTLVLTKDDLLAPENISKQIEQKRTNNPYYLTSTAFMMGSPITEGQHLYINYSNKTWKDALMFLLDNIWKEQDKYGASSLYLRDFNAQDKELDTYFMQQGLIKINLPNTNVIENINWNTSESFLQQLNHKKRNYLKREILAHEPSFEMRVLNHSPLSDIDQWHQLYRNIKNRSFELNTFDLPRKFFNNINLHPSSDVVGLFIKPNHVTGDKTRLVSITFNFRTASNHYAGIIMGLDYHYQASFNVYKQTLYQSILRAGSLNAKKMFLGLTAPETKGKFGAISIPQVAYVQMKDNYNLSIIDTVANTTNAIFEEAKISLPM